MVEVLVDVDFLLQFHSYMTAMGHRQRQPCRSLSCVLVVPAGFLVYDMPT